MSNEDIQAAQDYHEETKHSEISVQLGHHSLDFANKPLPFKVYKGNLKTICLPHEFQHPDVKALEAISSSQVIGKSDGWSVKKIDINLLAEVLFFSGGLTRKMNFDGEVYYMRAASATGALYPIEIYVVTEDLEGLEAGVYHFDPLKFALTRLRLGDYRGTLALLAGEEEDVRLAPFSVILTSVAWRNAWKYEARSYRHWFWDSGVIAANLLATCAAQELKTRIIMGFVDREIDKLLGLKEDEEATVAIVPVGIGASMKTKDIVNFAPTSLFMEQIPLSEHQQSYPQIWNMNNASSLGSLEEVKNWKKKWQTSLLSSNKREKEIEQPTTSRIVVPLKEKQGATESLTLTETILQRGSTRRFARKTIPLSKLSQILLCSTRKMTFEGEWLAPEIFLIANAVEGLPLGSYFFDMAKGNLVQLKQGNFRNMSSYLCLGQPLFGDASATLFLMSDLEVVLKEMGNRGYRLAQFESGVTTGKVYLSAYSLKLGASGSTFYDDAVSEFFSPLAAKKSTMIAVGVGVPAYKAHSGKILVG